MHPLFSDWGLQNALSATTSLRAQYCGTPSCPPVVQRPFRICSPLDERQGNPQNIPVVAAIAISASASWSTTTSKGSMATFCAAPRRPKKKPATAATGTTNAAAQPELEVLSACKSSSREGAAPRARGPPPACYPDTRGLDLFYCMQQVTPNNDRNTQKASRNTAFSITKGCATSAKSAPSSEYAAGAPTAACRGSWGTGAP